VHDSNVGGYVGTDGDLIQVLKKARTNSTDSSSAWYSICTQYRYHNSGVTGTMNGIAIAGNSHQLKAVILPEQIEYFANLGHDPSTILAATDTQTIPLTTGTYHPLDLAAKIIEYETSGERRVVNQYVRTDVQSSIASPGMKLHYDYYD